MTRRYVITTPANRDLEEILRNIAEFSGFDQSDRFLTRFSEKLSNIVAFPNLGKSRPAWGANYRTILLDDYLIVYRSTEELVEILRLVSGRRDLDTLFNNPNE
jgi:toxin ParE1/3/4